MKKLHIISLMLLTIAVISIAYITNKKVIALPNIKPEVVEKNAAVRTDLSLNDSIVDFAMTLLGTPYEAAGCDIEGFDCSGFVYFVFKHFYINVPRSSADFENYGKAIPIEEVEKGDVVVFLSPTEPVAGHIGIVCEANGTETRFIHATSGREMKVVISSLTDEGYKRRFIKAVSVI